jgi:hypothetical protein
MYIDINTWFTFEVSKIDDQSILAAIVRLLCMLRKSLYTSNFVAKLVSSLWLRACAI